MILVNIAKIAPTNRFYPIFSEEISAGGLQLVLRAEPQDYILD